MTLPTVKPTCQGITLLLANDMELGSAPRWGMVKRAQRPARGVKRAPPTLYVGQWIRALGKRQRDVARGTSVTEGYLSLLVNGGRKNPSLACLAEIADFLGIPAHYLYRPPPPRQILETISGLDPETISRLGSAHPSDESTD